MGLGIMSSRWGLTTPVLLPRVRGVDGQTLILKWDRPRLVTGKIRDRGTTS